jgi:hypothetical protein
MKCWGLTEGVSRACAGDALSAGTVRGGAARIVVNMRSSHDS